MKYSLPCLAYALILLCASAQTFAHPGLSPRIIDVDVAKCEARLRLPFDESGYGAGERIRVQADLADARFRQAIAEGRSHQVALLAWRDFDACLKATSADTSVPIGVQLALAETRVRRALAERDGSERAVIEEYRRSAVEQQQRAKRASALCKVRCISSEEFQHAVHLDLVAQVNFAAAEGKREQVVAYLQSLVDTQKTVDTQQQQRLRQLAMSCEEYSADVRARMEVRMELDAQTERLHQKR